MMDCYFLERERYVKKKKKDKVTHAVGFVRTKHVPGFCDVFWVLGSVFGFWQVFCPYEPNRTSGFVLFFSFTYLSLSKK